MPSSDCPSEHERFEEEGRLQKVLELLLEIDLNRVGSLFENRRAPENPAGFV